MTYSYDETRDREQLRLLEPAVDKFIDRCRSSQAAPSTSAPQTVFFFPGGMASQLTRATKKFIDGGATHQEFEYERIWVTPETFVGGARQLKMHWDHAGAFRDEDDRIIIADAAVSFGESTPHDGLVDWCANNHVHLFVFPWDWRRRLDEAATFFVAKFLPCFRARVRTAGCPDPLASFALIGHSFGGMLANLILRGNDPILATMTHAITVGTPFYGYAGQLHRWFEGERYLNLFGEFKRDMMETIASLPGLYVLHFLDEDTYSNSTNLAALTAEGLPSYPSIDSKDYERRADAYNPQTDDANVRYPTLTGFSRAELDYGRRQFQHLASAMDPDLLKKFHNIRGVRTRTKGNTVVDNTIGSIKWDWIPTNFDEHDESPIHDDKRKVPGDDTQPAWTACLGTNADRCVTVQAQGIEHACLLNHNAVLNEIQTILCPQGVAMSASQRPQPQSATDQDVIEFLQWLSQNRLHITNLKSFDDPKLQMSLSPALRDKLPGIARRFIRDVMKRTGPSGLRGPEDRSGGRKTRGPAGGVATQPQDRKPAESPNASTERRQPTSRKKKR